MKIKIISDGNPINTMVIDKVTGEKLEHVKSVKYEVAVGELGTASIEFINVEAELEGEVVEASNVEADDTGDKFEDGTKLVDTTGLGQPWRTYEKRRDLDDNS